MFRGSRVIWLIILSSIFLCITEGFSKTARRFTIPYVKAPEIKGIYNWTSHFQYAKIRKYCNVTNWDRICESNDTNLCAVRRRAGEKGDMEYKDFENSCYLFLSNMCHQPGQEFNIMWDTDCETYLARRRTEEEAAVTSDTVTADTAVTSAGDTASAENSTILDGLVSIGNNSHKGNQSSLRTDDFVSLYSVDWVFDGHDCPLSCPSLYSPVCININRGHGRLMKILTFVNHCLGDLHYCKNPGDFEPPPGYDDPIAAVSLLSWSFCASSRYIGFARFTEVASSMAHYGWLYGDHKAQHILEPHERKPGYG